MAPEYQLCVWYKSKQMFVLVELYPLWVKEPALQFVEPCVISESRGAEDWTTVFTLQPLWMLRLGHNLCAVIYISQRLVLPL